MTYLTLIKGVEGFMTAGGAKQPQDGQQSPMTMMLIMFALIAFSFYFIILRPQKKEQSERKRLLSELGKGDKVVSIGGIHGTVTDPGGEGSDTVTLEIDKNVRVKILKSAIANVTSKK